MIRYALTDYLATTFASSTPIVEGLLNKEQNALLVATQKAGKTILSCQLALCVAHGVSFLRWQVPKPLRVLYFAFEGSDASLQRRLRRQAAGLGIESLSDHLVMVRTPYLFLANQGTLTEVDKVMEAEHPDLVVFDPLYRLLTGGSISDDAVVMAATGALLSLSMRHHHATWLPTHEHRARHDTFGSQYELPAQRYAGSYVLAAWCESMFGLEMDAKTKKASFSAHFERDEEVPREPLNLRLLSTPEKLAFELGVEERIMMRLPELLGLGMRAAARELGVSQEGFRQAAQVLAKQGRIGLAAQGPGKETIIVAVPDATD